VRYIHREEFNEEAGDEENWVPFFENIEGTSWGWVKVLY
jgi:hypothetical protein